MQRIKGMFPHACDEIKAIKSDRIRRIIGGQEIRDYVNNLTSIDMCIEKMHCKTMQYAKRQRTWFRHQMSGLVLQSLDKQLNKNAILNLILCC